MAIKIEITNDGEPITGSYVPIEDRPWPFCYPMLIFRMFATGGITIYVINQVLELYFGYGEDHLSYLWGALIAFIPFIGSLWMVPFWFLVIALILPPSDAILASQHTTISHPRY